jgi:hypothetical protein
MRCRDGKLTGVAADHPGRMVIRSGDDPIGMYDRQEYLGRVLRVVTNPDVDGIMATMDVIEDVFIVNHLVKQGDPLPEYARLEKHFVKKLL